MSDDLSPTQTLREEHRVILRALVLLEVAAGRLSAGRPLPEGWWDALLGWLRRFADLSHHAKEERCLFPALADAGVPAAGGPVSVMLEEYDEGRALVRAMGTARVEDRVAAARHFVPLLREHIDKENGVLLPLADGVLDAPTQRLVARGFEKVEGEQGDAGAIEPAETEVDRLAAALGD